jgi:hypothetical protein
MVAAAARCPGIMGFFKDLKQLSDTGKQMQRDAGIRTGFGGMKDAVAQANATLQNFQQGSAEHQRIMATGTVATGIVKAIRNTGMMVNMSPQIEFDLEVTIPGQPAYTTTVQQIVNPVNIPQVQPGMPVSLRVDPMDVNQALIVGV